MTSYTRRFEVLSHKVEKWVTACHCPGCGKIYHFGKYRIQGGDDIVCYRGTTECECGAKALPFPMLFNDVKEVGAFYKKLSGGAQLELSFASFSAMELAFVDPEFMGLSKQ